MYWAHHCHCHDAIQSQYNMECEFDTPGTMSGYTLSVNFIMTGIYVTPTFGVASSVTADVGGSGTQALTTITQSSPPWLLATGANALHVISTQDGTYTITVTRSTADMTALSFSGTSIGTVT